MATELRDDLQARADQHAREAERLLKSRLLSSHIKGLLNATLAVYYGHQAERR
jgi:hypothetical protein